MVFWYRPMGNTNSRLVSKHWSFSRSHLLEWNCLFNLFILTSSSLSLPQEGHPILVSQLRRCSEIWRMAIECLAHLLAQSSCNVIIEFIMTSLWCNWKFISYDVMLKCWQWNSVDRPTFSDLVKQLEEILTADEPALNRVCYYRVNLWLLVNSLCTCLPIDTLLH